MNGGWTVSSVRDVLSPETKKALRAAGKKVRDATTARDALIAQALKDEGASLREVGEAVGLSHQGVKFIAYGRR